MGARRSRQVSDDPHHVLRQLLSEAAPQLMATHLWWHEADRWRELVSALMTRAVPRLAEDEARDLADHLGNLDFLDVRSLVSGRRNGSHPNPRSRHARRMIAFLEEHGLSTREAQRATVAIREAALGLHKHFNGKIQRYLRWYGEQMVRETSRFFKFSSLTDEDVGAAFTYWLQNALVMPLSLIDPTLRLFCHAHGIRPTELVAAADEVDLNVGVLDDLVYLYVQQQASSRGRVVRKATRQAGRHSRQGR